jgi:methyl-accepting chemotaxis protein
MGASIAEIAHSAQEAARVGATATQHATQVGGAVSRLQEASQQIGEAITAIRDIAEQTKTLALNATIEAARAGEVGRGFAVVAGEVKDLAGQTAQATSAISTRVTTIQTEVAAASKLMNEITSVIGSVTQYQNEIASAVDQQTATTQEMSRSIAEAATGAQQIAEHVADVATSVGTSAGGASDTRQNAEELSRIADTMRADYQHYTL